MAKFFSAESLVEEKKEIEDEITPPTEEEVGELKLEIGELEEELEECHVEVADDGSNMEQALESLNALYALREKVRTSKMDDVSNDFAKLSLESIHVHLGGTYVQTASLEADISGAIGRVLNGIKNSLGKTLGNIADSFKSQESLYEKYLKILKGYQTSATGIEAGTVKNTTVASDFSADGKAANFASAQTVLKNTAVLMNNGIPVGKQAAAFFKNAGSAVASGKTNLGKVGGDMKKIEDSLFKGLPTKSGGGDNTVYGPFIGHHFFRVAHASTPSKDDGTVYFTVVNANKEKSKVKTIETIPADKLQDFIKDSINFTSSALKSIREHKQVSADVYNAFMNDLVPEVNKAHEKNADMESIGVITKSVTSIDAALRFMYFNAPYLCAKGVKSAAAYIEASSSKSK